MSDMTPGEEKGTAAESLPATESAPATEEAARVSVQPAELVPALEAVLFAAPEPLTLANLRRIFGEEVPLDALREATSLLAAQTEGAGRGILLAEIAGGWQFLSRSEFSPLLQRMGRVQKRERLSPAALETLAVVAYKQPCTRAEVDAIRGVDTGALLRSLMDLKLLKVTGRAAIPGAPFQYGTTRRFLEHFGLRSIKDLPGPKEVARLLTRREEGSSDHS